MNQIEQSKPMEKYPHTHVQWNLCNPAFSQIWLHSKEESLSLQVDKYLEAHGVSDGRSATVHPGCKKQDKKSWE